ncbi:MAG TPA: DUF3472 domain-containing protein [Pirellulales bacterium]|nr:DUF3472 domain-containing protein [Pirellulales bacterium]
MRLAAVFIGSVAVLFLAVDRAAAQHLWWDAKEPADAICLYGEITVLASHDPIYYCGANWHPGEPAGGYCGIQHNSSRERRTIFSIWDTSPQLRPKVTEADPQTVFNRFGGEGEGAHTHMLWNWQVGETFQFFVRKTPVSSSGMTDTRYYVFDRDKSRWRHSATITNPNGDEGSAKSVATLAGGGLASFLENFGGRDQHVPKLALYRLWLGTRVEDLKCLTRAQGDGIWGQLHGDYFLAEGDKQQLDTLFQSLQEKYGAPLFGDEGKKLPPIADKELPAKLIADLKELPQATKVKE